MQPVQPVQHALNTNQSRLLDVRYILVAKHPFLIQDPFTRYPLRGFATKIGCMTLYSCTQHDQCPRE